MAPVRVTTFGLADRTILTEVDKNLYLAVGPIWWAQATYMTSLYSLLFRVALETKYKDGNAIKYLSNITDGTDAYIMKTVAPKIQKLTKASPPAQDWTAGYFHGAGIYNAAI